MVIQFDKVHFRIGNVVFTRLFTTETVAVVHELSEHVVEAMSVKDVWRCTKDRCYQFPCDRVHDRCPCTRPDTGYTSLTLRALRDDYLRNGATMNEVERWADGPARINRDDDA
jgi:hypothetical protein